MFEGLSGWTGSAWADVIDRANISPANKMMAGHNG
jgi:hypothetical protein